MLLTTLLADTKAMRVRADEARRAGDTVTQAYEGTRARLMTTVCSDIAKEGKDDGNRDATDKDALKILRRFVNGIDESLSALSTRADDEAVKLTAGLHAEKALLQPYLDAFEPKAAPEADVEAAARAVVAGLPDKSPKALQKAMGTVMNALKAKFGDTLDGTVGSTVAKRVLAEATEAAGPAAQAAKAGGPPPAPA
jgi:uncharacterized protein YqeY